MSINNQTFQTLASAYEQLETVSKNELGLDISAQKMLTDSHYEALVIKELAELEHAPITLILNNITQIKNPAIAASTATTHSKIDANHSTNRFAIPVAIGASLAVIMLLVMFILKPKATPPPVVVKEVAPVVQTIAAQPVISPPVVAPLLPSNNAELKFRLHGSNTIGEKLAPALIQAYLKKQGIEDMQWVQGDNAVEKTLQYVDNKKVYAIEIHAHGSSTAFEDLNKGQADIGMASRRVKRTEAENLKAKTGDLNKVGNEHIIGLDGLAIIVNQNNTIKSVSTETLSKIFSGEITNWAQLGGASLPIKVFSRDSNSGTWDTFKNLVLKKHKKNLAATAMRLESSSELSTLVSQDEGAIGFIGLNYIQHNKALAISEGQGTTPIFPTRFTIGTEDYALSRRLYFYTPTRASNIIKDFSRFAISQSGQAIVEKTGLISQNIKVERVYPMPEAPTKYNEYVEKAERLSLNFRFNYANKDLDNKGKRDLDRLIEYMELNPSRRLILMGFSDSIGAKIKNKALSLNRAKAVENELISRGINVLAVEGFGELLPVANNDNDTGRERNRRVEVWVI